MAQAATITVNDRETTPVAHSFVPGDMYPFPVFLEKAAVPIADKTLTIRRRKSGARTYVRVTLAVPTLVMETVNGVSVPTVPRLAFIDATFRFDDTSTLQERKNAVGMFYNALASSQTVVDDTLTGLNGIW